ncbi:2-amino-4-hydroxy-6-hydroxymethyldihydropteridine diphosphokinase [Bacillus sp. FJAT-45350]|uniref:2-amino-4-hydroxy-6- hydroxymethyldihydropteridine diphosphokinase n=1 Tax=Bacillus sp. FJAT-45350 TaxID=2011014 RepID=UPI000BB877E4|nr:2-amino-4-hydroxy-6-hydroxymethyldihydropteridine diphosphokinase [Bacillus sp. FJAT-45350]
MNNEALISLGSNIEKRDGYLQFGLRELSEHEQIEVMEVSSIYETAPIGYTEQEHFLNLVVQVKTSLLPMELLRVAQKIENDANRKRVIRWGPRTLDLDILLYNQENIKVDDLSIPHPRMNERGFVIIPLQEIQPSLYFVHLNKPIKLVYKQLTDKEGVRLWKRRSGEGEFGLFEN